MITLPTDAFTFLRKQRTEYAKCSDEEAQSEFSSDVLEFANRLRPYLPPEKRQMRFIDIGCGIGFALLGLLEVYGPQHRFVGVDRGVETPPTEAGKILYGFSETPSAYNSLQVTRNILVGAGVPADHVECVDVDTQPFPQGSADVVTSTYAWGFHFPVATYLKEVEALLTPDGVVVIDVRRDVGQEEIIEKSFDVVHAWRASHGKSDQVVLKRKCG
jgi:SAM-dependent methyltransferase